MKQISEKSIYNYLRGFTLLFCGFFFIGDLFGILNPSLVYSYSPFPSSLEVFIDRIPNLIFLIAVLIPHRWSLSKKIFYPKLLILVLGGFWYIYLGFNYIYEYFHFYGTFRGKDRAIIPVNAILIAFAISSPVTLYIKKRLHHFEKSI